MRSAHSGRRREYVDPVPETCGHARRRSAVPWRAVLAATLGVAILAAAAQAQDYPSRPVRLIVAFTRRRHRRHDRTADRRQDARTRSAKPLRSKTSRAPTAPIAAQYVAQSDPDGYTLFFTTVGAIAIEPGLPQRPALRSAQGFCRRRQSRDQFAGTGGQCRHESQFGARACRAGPQETRRHHHRHHRPRRHVRSRPAIIRGRCRHPVAVGALSRRGASHHRYSRAAISTAWSATFRR